MKNQKEKIRETEHLVAVAEILGSNHIGFREFFVIWMD